MSQATPDVFFKALNVFHKVVLKVSGGRLATNLLGMQVVELTTTGRKSGEPRKVMLTAPIDEGARVVLVASKNGNPGHPAWYLNLRDNPEVQVQIKDDKFTARARDATPEERPDLWKQMAEHWPDYDNYQEKTDREIPIVILERAA